MPATGGVSGHGRGSCPVDGASGSWRVTSGQIQP